MFSETINDKLSLHEYFKQKDIHHYIVPGQKIPLKMVVRGLRRIFDMDFLKEILSCRTFTIFKISQIKIR